MSHPTLEFLSGQAEAALAVGDLAEADRLFRLIVTQDPGHFKTLYNLGALAFTRHHADQAIAMLRRAALAAPLRAEPWISLAGGMARAQRWEDCVTAAREALVRSPLDGAMHRLAGEALCLQDDHAGAAKHFQAALDLTPNDVWLRWRLGLADLEAGRPTEALAHLVPALASQTLSSDCLHQTGVAFYNQGLTTQAQDMFELALAKEPENVVAAWYRMTSLLPQVPSSEEEAERCRAAYATALGELEVYCLAHPAAMQRLATRSLALPFYLPYQGHNDRALQQRLGALLARIMAHHPLAQHSQPQGSQPQGSQLLATPPRAPRRCGGRRRIGIVSGFFRLHSNWKIPIKGWLEGLDRSRFEVIGYYTDGRIDRHTARARELCDRFVQGPLSIEQWISRIGDDQPDVLLYPEIGMDSVTGTLAALRLAPVQCAAWGHPETSGLPTIDYFLSSTLMEIPEADAHYTEKLVRLPHLSISYRPDHLADIDRVTRAEFDLGETDTVYWCCQNLSKYLPRHDSVFARIARAHPPARFLFIDDPDKWSGNRIFRQRLAQAFVGHGLDWQRHCRFLPRLAQPRFLGVTRLTDLFLDSIGWSGCNSVLDALSLGVPVVTLPGQLMRSRHAAAILTRLGIEETIARDEDDYVFLAVQLGQDRITRLALQRRICERRATLFDDSAPVRALADFLDDAIAEHDNRDAA